MKNHIIDFFEYKFDFKIGAIIGTNGYVWIYSPTHVEKGQDARGAELKPVGFKERECMAILRGVILCLEREQLPIFKDTIDLALKQYFSKQKTYNI